MVHSRRAVDRKRVAQTPRRLTYEWLHYPNYRKQFKESPPNLVLGISNSWNLSWHRNTILFHPWIIHSGIDN